MTAAITGNAPAFPARHFDDNSGMTLRDYFAAAALPIAQDAFKEHKRTAETQELARFAYMVADALLAAREKQP